MHERFVEGHERSVGAFDICVIFATSHLECQYSLPFGSPCLVDSQAPAGLMHWLVFKIRSSVGMYAPENIKSGHQWQMMTSVGTS